MNARQLVIGLALAQISAAAAAGPILFDNRTQFENQGTIAEFQDFESFNADEFSDPGALFVDGSVTYTSPGSNLIVGANTFINPLSNTLSYDDFDTALTADIGGAFNMFGLDIAVNGDDGLQDVSLTLFTNVSSYLLNVALPQVQDAQLFQGFVLPVGEFFTGFEFGVLNFVHVDNVTLGNAVAVPEPPAMLLLMAGMLSVGVSRRKRDIRRLVSGQLALR